VVTELTCFKAYDIRLKALNVQEVCEKQSDLVENVLQNQEQILISVMNKNAVLIAESDW
jgi:PHD/YefM family antitoxin component YafN of YafNO toxin-antitoxin module